jgi:hypothetical protein
MYEDPEGERQVGCSTQTSLSSSRPGTKSPFFSTNEQKVEVTEGGQSEFVILGESDSIIQDAVCFKCYKKRRTGIFQMVVAVLIALLNVQTLLRIYSFRFGDFGWKKLYEIFFLVCKMLNKKPKKAVQNILTGVSNGKKEAKCKSEI